MPAVLQVGSANAADAEALSAFSIRLFPLGGRPGADPAHIQQYVDQHLRPQHFLEMIGDSNLILLVAKLEAMLAGFILMAKVAAHSLVEGDASELRKLY